jgi:hypothetical protein
MSRPRRATQEEKVAYLATPPRKVYPLWGWVKIEGHRCPIEFPNEGEGNPKYEIMAPEGFHFMYDETHSLLCYDMKDVVARSSGAVLTPCNEHCR